MATRKRSSQKDQVHSSQFAARLKELVDSYESASSLAREVGVVEGTVRKWANGTSQPKIGETIALAKAAKVNLLWLAIGEGPKHLGEPAVLSPIDLKSLQLALETVEQALENTHRITEPAKKAQIVAAIYDLFAEKQPFEKAKILKLVKTMV